MAFANEFERLRQTMEQSRSTKEELPKDTQIGQDAEDEQIFTSSIKQLWQQAVNMHKQSSETGEQNQNNEPGSVKQEVNVKTMDSTSGSIPEEEKEVESMDILSDTKEEPPVEQGEEDEQGWPEFPQDNHSDELEPEISVNDSLEVHDIEVEVEKIEGPVEELELEKIEHVAESEITEALDEIAVVVAEEVIDHQQEHPFETYVPESREFDQNRDASSIAATNSFHNLEDEVAMLEGIPASVELQHQAAITDTMLAFDHQELAQFNEKPIDEEPAFMLSETDGDELSSPVESLTQISFEQLTIEMDDILKSVYSFYCDQLENLFGSAITRLDSVQIQESQLANYLREIADVVIKHQGKITVEARQAVHFLLAILWRPIQEEGYHVPEKWYKTHFGFLCQYIKSGVQNQKFDPIDIQQAAALLQMSEKEIIKIYPRLGGVKLGLGYVFSRQKVEEYKAEIGGTYIPITIETLQGYYCNTKECLTKLIKISQFMNDSYEEIRYIRDLLLTGTDLNRNRIKQPIKVRIEQRLAQVYRSYQEVLVFGFAEIEVAHNEQAVYSIPKIFGSIEQFGGESMTGDVLAQMLEEMIKMIDDERAKINELTIGLTKNLGQLNIEIELLKIKEAL